ncbi:site-specific integrase [Ochrobactrum sp. SFR4]|uniref:tyrosine-type recombinase/integrase n=1 Tax=Ochrobactrum sp. SFR4 TaxID=2717368 RepID=UPI001C8C431E|nr:site-specific integrase [Ochrobactrum sp. SFR4]MBX8826261.1 integrase arm-type DNA-binding domain-containing protein [Ochrobactrum sp. SFR4]
MTRTINKLSAAKVAKETSPGLYGDGGGLWLQVTKSTAKTAKEGYVNKSWLFRYMLLGKARYMGLGNLNTFSLSEARERARRARQLVADGIDPVEARRAKKAEIQADKAKRVTFSEAAKKYIAAHRAGWKNEKHAVQWQSTIDTYAARVIGDLRVEDVEIGHIIKVLEPIWTIKAETASRLRGRIESILDWATVRGFRKGENPARWRGHLDKLLPARSKVAKVKHQPALSYTALPDFMKRLRNMDSISARALEFTILTAARTGETIGARRSEIDMSAKIWTIPPERMKSGREHRVPLTDRAIEIIQMMPSEGYGDSFVFPGARKGKGLSNMAMLELLKGVEESVTVHGFRSSFRDWAGEKTNFPRDLAEVALAHVLADKTEAAYRRGDALERRRRLMLAWERYCTAKRTSNDHVVAKQSAADDES